MYRKVFISFSLLLLVSLLYAQGTRTVHLEQKKKGMDVYIDIPSQGEVQTFSFGFLHHTDIVSIHLEKGTELGDVYVELTKGTLQDLKNHKKHGIDAHSVRYYRESENDLIIEYENPQNKKHYYEFHFIKELGGNKYYICSDANKEYDLDTVLRMHEMAETLRLEP